MKRLFAILLISAMALCLGCSAVFDTVTGYADQLNAAAPAGEGAAEETGGETAAPSQSQQGDGGTLTVYTCMPDTEWPYFINAFIEQTGIEVYCVSMSQEALENRLLTERDDPKASVVLGGNTSLYESLSAGGVLAAYSSPSLANIPSAYRDPNGYWTPLYVDAVAFVFNESYFSARGWSKPATWADLTNGSYEDGIILAHPAYDDITYEFLAILNQQMGSQECRHYMRDLSSTVQYYSRSTEQALSAVASGAAGITLAYAQEALYYTTPAGGGAQLSVYFPSEGTICEISALGLVNGGVRGEEENARAFIDWIAGKSGQDVIQRTGTFHIPANENADIDPAIIPISQLILADYDEAEAARERDSIAQDFLNRIDDASTMRG